MSEYKYYIKKTHQPSPDQIILELGDKRGRPVFNYLPGQYMMISYRNSLGQIEDKHAFSLSSSPSRTESISFGIRIEGPFTQGLLNLKLGDEVSVFGPYGKFYYDPEKYSDLVMIAGGIGITPFFSAMNYATDLKLNNKLSLIYSARTKDGATFYNEIKNLEKINPNISALFSFTDETSAVEPGIINKRIDAQAIQNFIGNIYGKTFFICGPSLFMAAMVANLLSLGVSRDQIEMEEFSMIPDKNLLSRLRNMSYALVFSILVFIISFVLIFKQTNAAVTKNYDPALVNKINQTAYNRMVAIYTSKNNAIADLNKQILAATNNTPATSVNKTTQTSNQTNVTSPSSVTQPVTNTPAPTTVVQPVQVPVVQTPVYTPAPVYTAAPVYTPAPTPVTSASPVR